MFQKILVLCFCVVLTIASKAQESVATKNTEDFVLPKPTGKYGVGRYWTSLKDSLRQHREIPVFLYYPVQGGNVTDYTIPTEEWRRQYLPVLQKKLGDSAGQAVAFSKAVFKNNPAITASKQKFPLILFSPGLGWSTLEYSYIIHELVSAGYVVAAINTSPLAPVLQTPEGRFLTEANPADKYQQAADDIVFVLQQLQKQKQNNELSKITRRIDFKNIAAAGHSLGGAAAVLAAHLTADIKTTVNMDGDLLDGSLKATPKASVLFLNQIPAGFETLSFTDMQKDTTKGWRYQQMSKATAVSSSGIYISIAGMYHSNFQDYALLPPSLIPENIRKWRLGTIEGSTCLRLIKQTLIVYFDKVLKNKQTDLLQLEKEHPAIRVIDIKQQQKHQGI